MATAMAAASGVAMEEVGSSTNSGSHNSRVRPSGSPGRHLFRKDRVEKNAFGEQNENTNLSIVDAAMASAAQKAVHAKKPLFQIDPRTSKYLSYWDSITGAPTLPRVVAACARVAGIIFQTAKSLGCCCFVAWSAKIRTRTSRTRWVAASPPSLRPSRA